MTLQVPMVLKRFQPRGSSRDVVTARLVRLSTWVVKGVKGFGTQSECIEHADDIHGKRTFGQLHNMCAGCSVVFPVLLEDILNILQRDGIAQFCGNHWFCSNPPCPSVKSQGILYHFALNMLMADTSQSRSWWRLIGFREHIFTVAHGICGARGPKC